jgi:hypothetical protein
MIFFQHPAMMVVTESGRDVRETAPGIYCTSAGSIVPGQPPSPITGSFDAYVIVSSGKFTIEIEG